jgi:hypothetical protein
MVMFHRFLYVYQAGYKSGSIQALAGGDHPMPEPKQQVFDG